MEYIQLVLTLIAIILLVMLLLRKKSDGGMESEKLLRDYCDRTKRETDDMLMRNKNDITHYINESIGMLATSQKQDIKNNFDLQEKALKASLDAMQTQLDRTEKRMGDIRQTVESSLDKVREDNNRKLDEMRKTVDEKLQDELQKRVRESFGQVASLLEQLQKDIGSMRTLAEDVGGLKKTLAGVKTRGMMGEFQLENILRDVFSENQYEKNAHTDNDNPNVVVEFAVKIPTEDDSFVYLPIDSKFPRDTYDAVLAATEAGDRDAVAAAMKNYTTQLKNFAKDISKYIKPPYTTDYAIMFLPTESMYADAVNHGMMESLWQSYKIYITGPSTIAALLGSMQLSFNNIAIQKRATEVFRVLTEVKTEFSTFTEALTKMQKHLSTASSDLETLISTRTNMMNRKLAGITKLAANDSELAALTDGE